MSRDLKKKWLTSLSVLMFAISGCLASVWWDSRDNSGGIQAHVGLIFGIPLVLLCRCRDPRLRILWLPASFLVWEMVLFAGRFLVLFLGFPGFVVAGTLGALLLSVCFLLFSNWNGWREVAVSASCGLLGGLIFAAALALDDSASVGSRLGYAAWQILVGSSFVWMSWMPNPDLAAERQLGAS